MGHEPPEAHPHRAGTRVTSDAADDRYHAKRGAERERLLDIAFRMLGSSSDAELAVELTLLQWATEFRDGADVDDDVLRRDQLTEVLARICFECLRSRTQRDLYAGDWLPEPLPDIGDENGRTPGRDTPHPADRLSLDDSLNMLLLVVLESLSPEERVAFILHDVFGVPFAGIAEVVGRSVETTRELTHSARRQVKQRKKDQVPEPDHRRIVLRLLEGCEAADHVAVKAVLDPGITVVVDSGGHVGEAHPPAHGEDDASRLLLLMFSGAPAMSVAEKSVNGHSGLVFSHSGHVIGVLSANIVADKIHDIWIVINPEKLRHWNARPI